MIHPDGIEVFIRPTSGAESYIEYDPPKGQDPADPYHLEKYIEAVNGENFTIVVRVRPGYRPWGSQGLRWTLYVDNWAGVCGQRNCPTLPQNTQELGSASSQDLYMDGQWKNVPFVFSRLDIDEDASEESSLLQEKIAQIGRIRVSVDRGFCKVLPQSEHSVWPVAKPSAGGYLTGQGSIKLVKGKGISHQTSVANAVSVESPLVTWNFTALTGRNAHNYTFDFRYRSRMRLEVLKIIADPQPQVKKEPNTCIDLTGVDDEAEADDDTPPVTVKRERVEIELSDSEDDTTQAARDFRRRQELEEELERIKARHLRRSGDNATAPSEIPSVSTSVEPKLKVEHSP